MSDDDPPVLSRSPRGTIVVRIRRNVQTAAARVVLGPIVKLALAGIAALAAAVWAVEC